MILVSVNLHHDILNFLQWFRLLVISIRGKTDLDWLWYIWSWCWIMFFNPSKYSLFLCSSLLVVVALLSQKCEASILSQLENITEDIVEFAINDSEPSLKYCFNSDDVQSLFKKIKCSHLSLQLWQLKARTCTHQYSAHVAQYLVIMWWCKLLCITYCGLLKKTLLLFSELNMISDCHKIMISRTHHSLLTQSLTTVH